MALTKDTAITDDTDIPKYCFEIGLTNLLEDTEGPWSNFDEIHKLAVNEIIDWLLMEGVDIAKVENPDDFKRAAIYFLCKTVFLGVSQRPDDEYWNKHIAYASMFNDELTKQLIQLTPGKTYPRARRLVVKNHDTNSYFMGDSNQDSS